MMKIMPLRDHPLSWRWTDSQYSQFSENELKQIKPLIKEMASKYYKIFCSLIEDNNFLPNKNIFQNIENIESNQFDKVKNWLNDRISEDQIILSWSEDTAIIVERSLFINKWDDFCYASSDDIIISSEKRDWVILYHHSEMFWHGT